jgi:hypothetical protein
LEREAADREAQMIAAGLEAASARGRADRLEIEVSDDFRYQLSGFLLVLSLVWSFIDEPAL